MANRKLGNVGNLGNLGKIIPSFLMSEFSILLYNQNRKPEFKNLEKIFPRFPSFPSLRPGPARQNMKLNYKKTILKIT